MKANYHKYIVLFVICAVSLVFQFKKLNEFPQYKHSWANCDRYALALGFINNGGDFFHPETFIYNNQFPGEFSTIRNTTITSVDFPIHDYIVSVIMKLFNTTDPWCFRVYILLYSLIGLFFLFKLVELFTNSLATQMVVVLFAISSPVFLYYQAGFLPTIPSLANAMIALFFLFRHYKNSIKKDYYLAILFLTLAVLARLPFAIVLTAVGCMEFLHLIFTKKLQWFKWIPLVISIACVGIYFVYNDYLRNEHGSLFLNFIVPASGWTEFKDFFLTTVSKWTFVYFSHIHYVLLLFMGLLFGFNIIRKKIELSELDKKLYAFSFILLFGCCLYYLLMTFQYLSHDYYFLDTFYLPMVCLFLLFMIKMPALKNAKASMIAPVLFMLLFVPSLLYAHHLIEADRMESMQVKEKTTAENFKNADRFLDALQIPKDAKILTMGTDGPNNSFILMKRKGYAIFYPDAEKIQKALKWPYDYVVLENTRLMNTIYSVYPDICNDLIKVAGNENISVFVKKTNNDRTDFDSFFNLNTMDLIYDQRTGFDTIPANFGGVDSLSNYAYSGVKAGYMKPGNEYGITWQISNLTALNRSESVLKVQSYFTSKDIFNTCLLCVTVRSKDKDLLFLSTDMSHFAINDSWNKQQLLFNLPKITEKDFELKVFIWNVGKNTLYYDDFEVMIYQ